MSATLDEQLAFALELRARLNRGNLRKVADGQMSAEESQRQTDALAGIIDTLEQKKLLAEVSEEMRRKAAT